MQARRAELFLSGTRACARARKAKKPPRAGESRTPGSSLLASGTTRGSSSLSFGWYHSGAASATKRAGLRGAAIRAPPSIPPPPPSARRTNPPSPFIRSADCELIVVARYAVIRARLLVLHARASVCKADAADFDDPAAPAASTRIVAY